MRIIGGRAKGRALRVPREVSRPTTDRVRESVFGMLSAVLEGARVLDLFAGSGALGLEALSRGAASCDFVEQNRGASRVLEENLQKSGLPGGRVRTAEAGRFLEQLTGEYDLIFADPPYADGLRDPAADLAAREGWRDWLADDGLLVLERQAAEQSLSLRGLEVLKNRRYGKSEITIYQKKRSEA